ncbi:MAG: Ig-like domain-containing protein, partial [Clostridia bacterium]|nr:Ig-like domain-containing protein [Clostridia bacterium]
MKKRSIIVLFVVFAVCLCTGVSCSCNGSQSKYPDLPPEKAQTMELEVASKTLAVDESFYLNVSGTNGLTPSFSVDDESVASVDRTGKVVALSIGTATITVSVGGENRKCYITVVAEKSIPVLKVKNVISEDGRYSLPVGLNDVYALNVSLLFKGAAVSGRINYSSTDPSVATVNDNGEVRAVGTGSATIVIYAEYEGRYQKETHTEIAVTVTDASWYFRLDDEDVYTLPSYNGVDYKNQVGFDAKLYLGGLEYGLDQLTVTVKESDVAEVADGVITGLKAGTTDIEVSYTADGKTYKTWRTLTVHAVETDYREDPAYSLCIEKRAAGDQVLTLPIAPETDEFSLRIGGKEIEIKNYDKTTREATIDSSQLLAVGDNNDLYGSIGNGVTVARFKVISIDYVLKTAEDFESKFNTEFFDDTANGGSLYAYYSFALNNDIDMAGKIINNAMWPDNANNSYNGTIDGRGHVIYNLTFNPALYDSYGGLINYKAGYGSVVKDIAFVNMTTPRAFITNKADGLVLRNVYISGTCEWGE